MDEVKKLFNELSKIKYGWHDKKGNPHYNIRDGSFVNDYKMQDINNISDCAICWELVEKERKFFKENNIPFICVFAYLKMGKKYPCHTFLVFKNVGYYYWFEASWEKMKGIKRYSSLTDVFNDIKNNFEEFTKTKDYNKEDIKFMKYSKPRNGIGCNNFYYHSMYFGQKIKDPSKVNEFKKLV